MWGKHAGLGGRGWYRGDAIVTFPLEERPGKMAAKVPWQLVLGDSHQASGAVSHTPRQNQLLWGMSMTAKAVPEPQAFTDLALSHTGL